MKKKFLKVISVVLCFALLISGASVSTFAAKNSNAIVQTESIGDSIMKGLYNTLNIIVEELFKSDPKTFDMRFKELIGHTPLQVVFGFLTGLVTAIALSFIPAFGVSIL